MDFICEPLYEHLVHQEHLEYLRHMEAKEMNNIENNGPIWTSLDPMLEGQVRMSFSFFLVAKKQIKGFNLFWKHNPPLFRLSKKPGKLERTESEEGGAALRILMRTVSCK